MNISRRTAIWFCVIVVVGIIVAVIAQFVPQKLVPPAVEYGEFPFKIEYKTNGTKGKTEDTLIYEYKGIEWNEAVGYHYEWDVRFRNGKECRNEKPILYPLCSAEDAQGNEVAVCFVLGDFEYFMENGRMTYGEKGYSVGDIILQSDGEERLISEEELSREYGVIILEKTLPSPISTK